MDFQRADFVEEWGFLFACVGLTFVWLRPFIKIPGARAWVAGYAALLTVFSATALTGLTQSLFLPVGPFLFALVLIFSGCFSMSHTALAFANSLPWAALIGFHLFRLPLEWLLHRWAQGGTVPETMTWTGQNIDVVSGIVVFICLPWVHQYKWARWAPTIIGLILLVNVIRVVIFSSPLPFAWEVSPPLLLAAYFPYCLIAPMAVLPALVAHIITVRRLLRS